MNTVIVFFRNKETTKHFFYQKLLAEILVADTIVLNFVCRLHQQTNIQNIFPPKLDVNGVSLVRHLIVERLVTLSL